MPDKIIYLYIKPHFHYYNCGRISTNRHTSTCIHNYNIFFKKSQIMARKITIDKNQKILSLLSLSLNIKKNKDSKDSILLCNYIILARM